METIHDSVARMQMDQRFVVEFKEFLTPEDDDLVIWEAWIRSQLGMDKYVLPSKVRAIYSVTGGFVWGWSFSPERTVEAVGTAAVSTIMNLYQSDDEYEASLSELLAVPRVFDAISPSEFVSLDLDPESTSSLVLRHTNTETNVARVLDLSPVEYMYELSRYCAIHGWQDLYSGGTSVDSGDRATLEAKVADMLDQGRG